MPIVCYKDGSTYQYNLRRWYFCLVFRDESQGQQRRSPVVTFADISTAVAMETMVAGRVGTYIQEWVIGLSEAATSIHDIAHVLDNSFLGDTVFEDDRVTCRRACMSWQGH